MKPQPPIDIQNLGITINSHWSEWSDCSKCGQVGKQIRKGICYVVQTENKNTLQTNSTSETAKKGNKIYTIKQLIHTHTHTYFLEACFNN